MSTLERLTALHGGLLVVDLQEKLHARMNEGAQVLGNAVRLVQAARALHMPVWATEQYPQGLGRTVPPLSELLPHPASKMTFSACAVPEIIEQLHGRGIRHVTLSGLEAHICIAQTALDLLRMGLTVQVPADAVTSRHPHDAAYALRRLERAGAIVTTTEAVLFEWLESADSPAFKAISALAKRGTALPEGPLTEAG